MSFFGFFGQLDFTRGVDTLFEAVARLGRPDVRVVMLGSAVCGQISTEELSFAANLIQSRNFRAFEAYIIATGIYLLLAMGVREGLNYIGPRWLFGR